MFYENRLGIKKSLIHLFTFVMNTGTKFREPYHSNHVIPHREFPQDCQYGEIVWMCMLFRVTDGLVTKNVELANCSYSKF